MSDQEPNRDDKQPNLKDLITLGEVARLSGFTNRHIRKLANEHQLWAVKRAKSPDPF